MFIPGKLVSGPVPAIPGASEGWRWAKTGRPEDQGGGQGLLIRGPLRESDVCRSLELDTTRSILFHTSGISLRSYGIHGNSGALLERVLDGFCKSWLVQGSGSWSTGAHHGVPSWERSPTAESLSERRCCDSRCTPGPVPWGPPGTPEKITITSIIRPWGTGPS